MNFSNINLVIVFYVFLIFVGCKKEDNQKQKPATTKTQHEQFLEYAKSRMPLKLGKDEFFPKPDLSKVINYPNGDDIYFNRIYILIKDRHNEDAIKEFKGIVNSIGAKIIGQIPRYGSYTLEVNSTTREELDLIITKLEGYKVIQNVSIVFAKPGKYIHGLDYYSKKKVKR